MSTPALTPEDLAALARLRAHGEDPKNWQKSDCLDSPSKIAAERVVEVNSSWLVGFGWTMLPHPSGGGAMVLTRHMTISGLEDPSREPEMAVIDNIGAALGFGDKAKCVMDRHLDGSVYATAFESVHVVGKEVGAAAGRQMRAAPMPGRNDPCPCGSAKKYKKCHGLVQTEPSPLPPQPGDELGRLEDTAEGRLLAQHLGDCPRCDAELFPSPTKRRQTGLCAEGEPLFVDAMRAVAAAHGIGVE